MDTYLRSGDFLCFFAELIQFCCLQPVISFQAPRNLKVLSLWMQTQIVVGNVDFLMFVLYDFFNQNRWWSNHRMNGVCNRYNMVISHCQLWGHQFVLLGRLLPSLSHRQSHSLFKFFFLSSKTSVRSDFWMEKCYWLVSTAHTKEKLK